MNLTKDPQHEKERKKNEQHIEEEDKKPEISVQSRRTPQPSHNIREIIQKYQSRPVSPPPIYKPNRSVWWEAHSVGQWALHNSSILLWWPLVMAVPVHPRASADLLRWLDDQEAQWCTWSSSRFTVLATGVQFGSCSCGICMSPPLPWHGCMGLLQVLWSYTVISSPPLSERFSPVAGVKAICIQLTGVYRLSLLYFAWPTSFVLGRFFKKLTKLDLQLALQYHLDSDGNLVQSKPVWPRKPQSAVSRVSVVFCTNFDAFDHITYDTPLVQIWTLNLEFQSRPVHIRHGYYAFGIT